MNGIMALGCPKDKLKELAENVSETREAGDKVKKTMRDQSRT